MRADEQAQRGQAAEAAVETTATVRVVSVASIRSIKRPSLKGRRGDTYMYTYRHSTEDSCSSSVTSIAASVSGNKRAVSPKVRMSPHIFTVPFFCPEAIFVPSGDQTTL